MSLAVNAVGPLINGASGLTFGCWAYHDTLTSNAGTHDDMISLIINSTTTGVSLAINGTTPKLIIGGRSQSGDSFQSRMGATTVTTGVWNHYVGVMDIAGDSGVAYLNGASDSSGAMTFGAASYTNGTPTGNDSIGCAMSGSTPISTTRQLDGGLGEVFIYNAVLNSNEVASLARGELPHRVRPESLVFYLPLWGLHSPEIELKSNKQGTITGTVAQRNHAPVRLFTRQVPTFFEVSAEAPATRRDLMLLGVGA